MNAVELFAGAGGLGLGLSLTGFKPTAVVEWDRWACDTIRENINRRHPLVKNWPLTEGDVREWIMNFSASPSAEDVDLVAGGPPCQPAQCQPHAKPRQAAERGCVERPSVSGSNLRQSCRQ